MLGVFAALGFLNFVTLLLEKVADAKAHAWLIVHN
jgi:hypothetical protein